MKGMQFFKKAGQKGGSLFGGMRVKGPTAGQKPKNAQPQSTNPIKTDNPSQGNQKLSSTMSDKGSVKSEKKEVVETASQQQALENSTVDMQQQKNEGAFELPLISQKNKIQKAQEIKAKPTPPKKQEYEVEKKRQQKKQEPKSAPQSEQAKLNVAPIRKDSERKQSASQSNYIGQKKKAKDKKQTNPFLNQIKKNTANPHSNRDISHDQQLDEPQKVPLPQVKLSKKSDKQNVVEQIRNSHLKKVDFIVKQKQLKQSIIEISGNLQCHRDDLSESIQKQCEHVEKEEYEEAEYLQNKIQNLQKKIQQQQSELLKRQQQFYKGEYDQLKFERDQHFESKKLIRQIKLAQFQLLDQSSNLKRKKAEYQQNENVKIENENKKIIRLQNDIKFQSEQISDFERKYNEDLNSRKDPLVNELADSNKKKSKLEEEIQDLERRLKQKKEALKEVTGKIGSLKKQIKEVQEIFRQEGVKIKERRKKVQDLERERKQLSQNLKVLQENKALEITNISKKSEELEREAANLTIMANQIEERENHFEDKLEQKKVKVDNFIHNTKILKEFEEKHKEQKQKIKELEFKKANIGAETNSLQQKINSTKLKIPKLEQQQKAMAASKNFKGANMKKAEIKEAQQEIESIKKKMEGCFLKQKQVEEQIIELKNNQSNYISEQNEIKKNLAISQFRFDSIKWEQLRQEISWVEKIEDKAKDEVRQKYQSILKQEMQNLEEQIRYIGEQYELSTRFLQFCQTNSQLKQEKQIKTYANQSAQGSYRGLQQQTPEESQDNKQTKVEMVPQYNHQQEENQIQAKQQVMQIENQETQIEKKEEDVDNSRQNQQAYQLTHGQNYGQDDQQDGGYVPLQLD